MDLSANSATAIYCVLYTYSYQGQTTLHLKPPSLGGVVIVDESLMVWLRS